MLDSVIIAAEQYYRLIQSEYVCINDMKEITEIVKEIKSYEKSENEKESKKINIQTALKHQVTT